MQWDFYCIVFITQPLKYTADKQMSHIWSPFRQCWSKTLEALVSALTKIIL